ncbi:glycoside hydrolase family 13 protein [Tessaracoccus sp. OH4464_COT-324]|uniref:glycoside hydrolase family 13 protein n=1 Tax=Tessaracoccus sp. OH4464_COT-324 TaxID=2491059 RepID=UPI000F639660|nr:glycoside hydrolase family 13 protein [Tessaracoccus sp. OH4464_COT-324]RRD46394.1 alpha-amylase [Tessaracoccus sp. OH4464_COT-324]
MTPSWWRDAVIYQIYPRSFADSDGDGYGDIRGIISRLDHVRDLGVDAVWLSPFYRSPMRDAGYDVADYRDIDPLFGDLADAEALIAACHERGLRIIVDLVPNHTSSDHVWFQEALAAGPGSPERSRYHFRDGRGPAGELPPNNWTSIFGGKGWTRLVDADGHPEQWYLHIFDVTQPDLNWDNEDVRAEFDDILRFWCDRGVDGFRVDVAHSLVKAPGLPDETEEYRLLSGSPSPKWDQDGVHDVYRRWRRVLDGYGERILVAEAWVDSPERLARYLRPDEMHTAFNFDFLTSSWSASEYRKRIAASLAADGAVGAPTTWVLSNHDTVRHVSRLGRAENPGAHVEGIGPDDPQPDYELGLRRARAATTMELALPGSVYLYQGEELGLPDHTSLPHEYRQDPAWFQSNHEQVGRDGCRVPLPWEADSPALGFSPTGATWLPQPERYRELAADRQSGVEGSTLELYRLLIRLRRELGLGSGELRWLDGYPDGVVAFTNAGVTVLTNVSADDVALPAGEVLAASEPLHGVLPAGAACWLR